MSFGHHTPESLLPRSDSKNPATTCKGITQNGHPCRRPLAATPGSSPATSPGRGYGVLAVLQDQAGQHRNAAAFYCWQHKDQADELAAEDSTRTRLYPLKEKSSIDTLVNRLGVLDLDGDQKNHRRKRRKHDGRTPKKRDTVPMGWQKMESPLMTVPEGLERTGHNAHSQPRPSHGRSNLKASFLCCLRADDDDIPPVRISQDRKRPQPQAYQQPLGMGHTNSTGEQAHVSPVQSSSLKHRKPVATYDQSRISRPESKHAQAQSQSQMILSLIPATLPPATAAALLTEASRPLTSMDLKTSGYIYIFWLTPPSSNADAPDSDIASTILNDTSPGVGSIQEQLLQRYSSQRRTTARERPKRTVLLKIGRATNVHRRMSQWQKQCGHDITLLRYYPRDPSSSTRAGAATANTPSPPVPLLPRVERLIQIELSASQVKHECETCGREHREWFEVDASRKGVRAVDEVVRRWVDWGIREGGKQSAVQNDEGYF